MEVEVSLMFHEGGKGGQPPLDTDHTQLFAQMIARTGKDIEVSLPLPCVV